MKILLNNKQKKASEKLNGNLLIIASAGTGKTTTIVERYKNLIQKRNLLPSQIMMTTFTNKAAKDMIKKIQKINLEVSPYVGTMHSLFLRILRENKQKAFGEKDYTIITDASEQRKIIKQILKEQNIDPNYDAVSYFLRWISKFKNRGILAEDLSWEGGIDEAKENGQITELLDDEIIYVNKAWRKKVNLIYKKYQEFLHKHKLMDFDEILILTYKLFRESPKILEFYKKQFKSIMVDEAQDLNVIQVKILEQLKDNNLCLIGDDCQNIYEWRGSSNDLIFKFQETEEKIFLEENYRSKKEIIEVVNKTIDLMGNKIDKKLISTRNKESTVDVNFFEFHEEEIDWIINQIEDLIMSGEKRDEIAVLFRTNMIGKKLEREFRRREIPCHLTKSANFFDREEIKDILAMLKLKVNPYSKIDFERIAQMLKGFGKAKIEKILQYKYENNKSFLESLEDMYYKSIPSVKHFLDSIKSQNPLGSFLDDFDYYSYLSNKYSKEKRKLEEKMQNISVLVDLYKKREGNVISFLDSLIDIDKKEKTEDKIILSTIHGAKGLEWKNVFLVSCNEKILPFYKEDLTKAKKDSELRLFYVAISRAKDKLIITSSKREGYRFLQPSQFLEILIDSNFNEN